MSPRTTRGRLGQRLTVAAVILALGLSAGCAGTPPPPGQAVPELSRVLSHVDRAVVAHEPGQARRQLRELIRTAVAARDAGRLDSTQADAVLAAAAGLLSALPRPRPRPEPTPAPPAPRPAEPGTVAPDDDHGGHGTGGHGKGRHEKHKGHEGDGKGDHGDHGDHGGHGDESGEDD